jgi:hypothetical protein
MRYSRIEEVFIKPNTRYGHILNIFNTKNSNHDNKLSILTKSFYPLNMIINISEKFHILIINTTAQTITMPNKSYLFDGLIIQLANGTYPIRLEPNKNPIWNVLTSVISSLYTLELENIKERTSVGRQIYVQRGGVLGRKVGSTLSDRDFIEKPKSQKILEYLNKEWTLREIAKQLDCSTRTIQKVKKIANKLEVI